MTLKLGTITVRGDEKIKKLLDKKGKAAHRALVKATREITKKIGAESQKEVPKDTGALAKSMKIEVLQIISGQYPVRGWISYNTDYAVYVHEIPAPPKQSPGGKSARHDPPTKWKYLEDPLKRNSGNFISRVRAAMKEALRK